MILRTKQKIRNFGRLVCCNVQSSCDFIQWQGHVGGVGKLKMKKKFNHVYQFKVTLKGIKPPVWRRIQVPETYSFWDLHVAIQDVFAWSDYHLHEFEIFHPSISLKVSIGIPDDEFDRYVLPGWKQKIADYFSMENRSSDYMYDFGDCWVHRIYLEKITLRDKNVDYPVCIDGKRACPHEDCGGIGGYGGFLEAIEDPNHEEHEELLEWAGGEFDPEYFNPSEVCFDDPDERYKIAFS